MPRNTQPGAVHPFSTSLIGVTQLTSKRIDTWILKAYKRVDTLVNSTGSQPKGPSAVRGSVPPVKKSTKKATNPVAVERRERIDSFIENVNQQTGRAITRHDIWTVAGYKHATEFERFQRGDKRCTASALRAFNRTLSLSPNEFVAMLDRKTTS